MEEVTGEIFKKCETDGDVKGKNEGKQKQRRSRGCVNICSGAHLAD